MNTKKLLVILAVSLALTATVATAETSCHSCHSDPHFKVTHPLLYQYNLDYQDSIHGLAEIECNCCHGGNPKGHDHQEIHEGVLDPVRFDHIPATCGGCHEEQRDAFLTSEHYKLLEKDGSAPSCVTCHGAMDMDFIFATRVKNTCLFCHNYETGTAPEIPQQADYILNKINVIKGYKAYVELYSKDKEKVADLAGAYDGLMAKWHRFDLDGVGEETEFLLASYRKAKAQAVKDRRKHG